MTRIEPGGRSRAAIYPRRHCQASRNKRRSGDLSYRVDCPRYIKISKTASGLPPSWGRFASLIRKRNATYGCARHGMKRRRSSDRCEIPCSRLSPAASAKTRRQKAHKPSHCFRFDREVHRSGANRSHSPGHRYLTAARVQSTFHIPRVVNVTARTFDETGRYAA
jgi:hypothetical protein